jgi:hypothetical protein
LQHEGHVCACASVHSRSLLFPDGVDILVKLSIDTGAGATVVVPDMLLANDHSHYDERKTYRMGSEDEVEAKICVRVFTVPFVGGTATARGSGRLSKAEKTPDGTVVSA